MNAPAYSASSLNAAFDAALAALGPFSHAPHIAIALSGGPDSMALTLLTAAWVKQHGGRITALTVDHGLRPDSEKEAQQVARWMRERDIDHVILTPTHIAESNNMLEAARGWRYDALGDWCRNHGVLHCLLGHHASDQSETIAINTARGESEDGASGMPRLRNYHGVRFLRPLLSFTKPQLLATLQSLNAPWVDDPTNGDPKFARARLRAQPIIAANDDSRTARDEAFANVAMRCAALSPLGYAMLNRAAWKELEPLVRSRLLADLLTTISGATRRPRKHETERLVEALLAGEQRATLHGCLIDGARIEREPSRVAAPVELSGNGHLRWDDRFTVHYELPEPLTLKALGQPGRKLLNIDVPLATPSLWHLDTLLHVPHIDVDVRSIKGRVQVGFAPAKPLAAAPFW